MTEMDILGDLPRKLKNARRERGLSLEAVSALSGVSRSMVSQIERGTSSPTVATLWNLTQALGVDFAGLLDSAGNTKPGIEVLSAGATPTIETKGTGCRIRILSPPEAAGDHEVYELVFETGGALRSAPHGTGAREHLTVISGRVEIRSGAARQALGPGDTARYPADQEHSIEAPDGVARAFLIVQGSG